MDDSRCWGSACYVRDSVSVTVVLSVCSVSIRVLKIFKELEGRMSDSRPASRRVNVFRPTGRQWETVLRLGVEQSICSSEPDPAHLDLHGVR